MGKDKNKLQFKEILIHSSGEGPMDPETSFNTFADLIVNTKIEIMGGMMNIDKVASRKSGQQIYSREILTMNGKNIVEVGPRTNLSSVFRFDSGSPLGILTFKLRYIIDKSIDIGYEAEIEVPGKPMKMMMVQSELSLRCMIRTPIVQAFNDSFTESKNLGKAKKIKLSASAIHMEKMFYPEGKKLSRFDKMSLAATRKFGEHMAPPADMGGNMCYLHPDVPALRYCDMCSKPICQDHVETPLKGQKLYLTSKNKDSFPYHVCPNCVEATLKKFGPKSFSQMMGYYLSHRK